MPAITLTEQEIRDGLLSPFSLAPSQFTFSLPNATSTWAEYGAGEQPSGAGYAILSVAQAAAFRAALAAWDLLIAPNFIEVVETATTRGEVRIAFTDIGMDAQTAGYAFQGSNKTPTSQVGDTWLNSKDVGASFDRGTDNYITLLHEIGHVLGLKHSFEAPVIPAGFENQRYTILSYTSATPVFSRGFASTGTGITTTSSRIVVTSPMVLDIAAVQLLYGADPTTAAGANVYTFTQGDTTISAIYDAGGTDTIDLSNFTRNNIVDLTPGGYSSIGIWTIAEQTAFWQAQFPGAEAFIAGAMTDNAYYEWRDNLGIALSTIIENATGGSGNDTITGNAVSNRLDGGAGNDVLNGAGGDDLLIAGTGNDILNGGDGDDGLYFGAHLTVADTATGGAGSLDQVGLQGNYGSVAGGAGGAHLLGATNLVGVELLSLLPGSDARFGDISGALYSYNIKSVDENVLAGERLAVNFNTLRAGENVRFDGSAEQSGFFLTFGGLGNDEVIGGQADDGFFFGAQGRWGAGDKVDGQGGTSDQLGLQGLYTGGTAVVFGANQLTSIEFLVLLTGGDTRFGSGGLGYSYDITMNDGNVVAGLSFIVSANTLRADEVLTFNGSAESDGSFRIFSGLGDDLLIGGQRDDQIEGFGGADTIVGGLGADTLKGGAGNDVFRYASTAESTIGSVDRIVDFATGDKIDLSLIDANVLNGPGDDGFIFIGSAAFVSGVAGQLRAVNNAGIWTVEGDVNGDGVADLVILVTLPDAITPLTGADFML